MMTSLTLIPGFEIVFQQLLLPEVPFRFASLVAVVDQRRDGLVGQCHVGFHGNVHQRLGQRGERSLWCEQ